MPFVDATHKAGISEALRHAQGIIERNVQTGIVVAAGERADRAKARQVATAPEAEESDRGRDPDDDHDGRERERQPFDGEQGRLIDIEA